MSQRPCPQLDDLSGYVTGTLAESQAEEVTQHLAACAACEQTVQELQSKTDSFVNRLKQPASPQPFIDEPQCQQAVEAVARPAPPDEAPKVAAPASAAILKTGTSLKAGTSAVGTAARPMNRDDFVSFVTGSGLLTTDELSAIESKLPAAEATNVQTLAKALVTQGKLTKYQAAAVVQGKTKGLVFGDYVVLERIGAGGMGQVFMARHRRMRRVVAIKVLPPAATRSPDAVKRFQREVHAAAQLTHPNIVTAYDAGESEGMHYLVMEHVAGQDLAVILKQRTKLTVAQAIDFVLQTARGLQYAHTKGIVHRDIKPANLLLNPEGVIKILDMGLARFDDAGLAGVEDGLTQANSVMGTVDYMAPEQAQNTKQADARSDIYSLGCTLYRLVTGVNAYQGETLVDKILAHRQTPIPSLRAAQPEVPAALDHIFQKMVAKLPGDRYQSASDIVSELEQLKAAPPAPARPVALAPAPQPAAPEIKPSGRTPSVSAGLGQPVAHAPGSVGPKPPRNRNVLVAAAGGACLLLLLGVIVIIKNRQGEEIARVEVPDGSTVEIGPSGGTPSVSAGPGKPVADAPGSVVRSAPTAPPPPKTTLVPIVPPAEPRTSVSGTTPKDPALTLGARNEGASPPSAVLELSLAPDVPIRFRRIPAGTFLMGSPPTEEKRAKDEEQHLVTITKPFYMGETEVTNAQWFAPKPVKEGLDPQAAKGGVNWQGAQKFIDKLNESSLGTKYRFRLPTEAEWEYACRAGTTTAFSFVSDVSLMNKHGWSAENSNDVIHPVAQLAPNPWGLYDIHGNVQEWCSDIYGPYEINASGPLIDPVGAADGKDHILRGNSYNGAAFQARSATRGKHSDGYTYPRFGFRLVCEVIGEIATASVTSFATVGLPSSASTADSTATAPVQPPAVAVPATTAKPLPPFKLPVGATEGMIGRMTVKNADTGAIVAYQPGKVFASAPIKEYLGPSQDGKPIAGVKIQLNGLLHVPKDMAVLVWHVGGSSNGGVHHLKLNGQELGAVGDDRTKNAIYSATLPKGEHQVVWELTGGDLGPASLVQFFEGATMEPLVVYVPAQLKAAAKSFPTKKEIANAADTPMPKRPADLVAIVPPPPGAAAEPERKAAQAILARGGKIKVKVNGQARPEITTPVLVPPEAFEIVEVSFYNKKDVADADVALVQNLASLRTLDLQGTRTTDAGLNYLSRLTNLEQLDLDTTQVIGPGLAHLAGLPKLKILILIGTPVTDEGLANHLARLASLESLEISRTQLSRLNFLDGLPKLKHLHVAATRVHGLASVLRWPDLESFNLWQTPVNDADLAVLKSLKTLTFLGLNETAISDAGLAHVESLTNLKSLDISKTRTTPEAVARLQAKLPACKIKWSAGPGAPPIKPPPPPPVGRPNGPPPGKSPTPPPVAPPVTTFVTQIPKGERLPVPDATAQAETLKLLKEIFADDYAKAKTAETKNELALKLMRQSQDADSDAVSVYVLHDEALHFAVDVAEMELLSRIITSLTTLYKAEPLEIWTTSLDKIAQTLHTPAVYKSTAETARRLAEAAVAEENFTAAEKLSDVLLAAARKSKDAMLIKSAVDYGKSLTAQQKQWQTVQDAQKKLETEPDDPAANLLVGKHLCFVKSDWNAGLPLLAKSGDGMLKELAAASLVPPTEAAALTELADRWWNAADKAKSKEKLEFQAGAAWWYEKALPTLAGLNKTRVEKRLADLNAALGK